MLENPIKINLKKRSRKFHEMNHLDADRLHNDRTNGTTEPFTVYPIKRNVSVGQEMKKRRRNSIEIIQSSNRENVTCERCKTYIIYVLCVVIVVLVAALCYTSIIFFENKTHAVDEITDDILEKGLPQEQHDWHKVGINELRKSIKLARNKNKAKNVILFIGDGMGISTVTATRIYKYGEEGALSWESFPHVGLLKVSVHP